MTEYIRLKKSNCKNCYKCIRSCPVKSIRFSGNQAHIVEDECILCGECFVVCPQDAKFIRNDLEKAKLLISGDEKVVASIAPSFVVNYPNATIQAMEAALKKLGFYGAEETAVGATIVKKEYEKMVREGKDKVIISSCCHSVNLLLQKYYPEALRYLAPVVSPMQAHCESIKERIDGAKTIFIGPCISKKAEAEKYPGAVDCVLTFEELTQWLKEEGVEIETSPIEKEPNTKARLFPTSGGILKTMDCTSETYSYVTVDGVDNCIAAITDLLAGKLENCFIEMSACKGSCIGGPVMSRGYHPITDFLTVNNYAGKEDFISPTPESHKLKRSHHFIGLQRKIPGERDIDDILRKMGKTKPEHKLNCGTCGYNTCRDKAIAVFQGKADLTMCLPFLKDKAESFSDNIIRNTPNGIIVINEAFEVQQINESALKLMNIRSASDVLGEQVIRILDPKDFFEVLDTGRDIHNRRVYLAEYSIYVEQTILYDKDFRIFIYIMRDVTERETEREQKERLSRQTMEIADQVAEKQMRVVQEIAYLLGETTAETKIAMTKLKESLRYE